MTRAKARRAREGAAVTAHWSAALIDLGACKEAVEWAATQPDAATAWAACERPDWLFWLADHTATTAEHRRAIVLAACDCARTSLRYVIAGEDRPRRAIEAAEAWCRGEATGEEVRRAAANADYARAAAYAAADAAYNAYAAYAAADAADATVAAYNAAVRAAYAANAANAANASAYAYAANAANAANAAAAYAANAANAAADARAAPRAEMVRLIRARIACPVLGVQS